MKVKTTDDEIISSIWASVAKQLPYHATHNYFGNRRGLAPKDDFWMRSSTKVCTAFMSARIETNIGKGQLMARVKRLVDSGRLKSEKRVKGSSFWFWLPDSINRPAFNLTQDLLVAGGVTEEPVCAKDFDQLAGGITLILINQFGELPEGLANGLD